jgi:hypothetical protein
VDTPSNIGMFFTLARKCWTAKVNDLISSPPLLKKSTMETFQLLTEANVEDCMSHACVFERHK